MAMQQKLALQAKLSQKLILTPSLQQAIKLLPMSTLELADMLNQEITENPLLEEDVETSSQEESTGSDGEEKPTTDAAAETTEEKPEDKSDDSFSEIDEEAFFSDYLDDGYRPRTSFEVPELPPIENTLASTSSLADHLDWQLRMSSKDELTLEIGRAIIGNVDDDGYLQASLEEICEMGDYPCDNVSESPPVGTDLRPHRCRVPRLQRMPAIAAPASRAR